MRHGKRVSIGYFELEGYAAMNCLLNLINVHTVKMALAGNDVNTGPKMAA